MKKYFILVVGIAFLAAACQKQVTSNNPSPTPQSPGGSETNANWQSYSSAQNGFSISYPEDFGFNTNFDQIKALGYIPVCAEATMAGCVFYSGDAYKGTNFENAAVSINILSSLNTSDKCYDFKVSTNETQTNAGIVRINDVDFHSATGGGAGAGHFSKAQSFRNFKDGKCYELYQSVGSTNIGNYEPGTIKEFNQTEVWQKLSEIVNTFKFQGSPESGATVNLGQEIKLKKNEVVYFKDKKASLKLTGFYFHPCPKGAQCIWSGLDVFYELTVNGKVYKKDKPAAALTDAPFQVSIKDSDYKTYAVVVITQPANEQVSLTGTTGCLPHRNVEPGQPQTMECAIGLKEEKTGKYYGIKNSNPPFYDTNVKVQVTGVLVEDSQSKYDVEASIDEARISKM